MDQLIKVINRLQDAFSAVNVSNPIDLPQIVVIGSQSSGKSSVLENIVGRDFLPRGTGIVTRRPLILQLINRPARAAGSPRSKAAQGHGGDDGEAAANDGERRKSEDGEAPPLPPPKFPVDADEADAWGEFLHKPGMKYFNFEKIRDEIVAETDRKTGSTKNISAEPIHLRLYSPNVLTLTLVDLPGLTKVPVGDQPKDIEKQLREMSLKFISRPNAIILAVTSANTDLANSDGLKLAREVDPEGLRTIGVLSKVDLMDKGTDVVDILAGRVIPLRLGYVPVVNRGQRDIEGKKTIKLALESEREFFENHHAYSSKAQYCGTPFLARKLHMILLHHIRTTLPEIKQRISTSLQKYLSELTTLGDITDGNYSSMILSIITEFTSEFRNILDGDSADLSTSELNGGARISFVFHEIFASAINAMDPFDQVKEADIRTLLYNSSGSTPALFVATTAFEVLVKQQIKRLEDPSLKCVQMIFDELTRILSQLLQKPVFRRFPALKEKFYATVISFFRRGLDPTCKLVSQLVAAEACYINTAHPDFVNGHKAMAIVYDKLQMGKPATPTTEKYSSSADAAKRATPSSQMGHYGSSSSAAVAGGADRTYNLDEPQGIFGSFFKKSSRQKPGVLEPPPAMLKASGSVSEREFTEIEVIKLLIQSYFGIVKQTTVDMIPKCIMLNLVVYSREELQRGLLGELYKEEMLKELLEESSDVISRRAECRKMIEALQKADEIVSTV